MGIVQIVRRAWGSITAPRHLKVFYLGVYALTTAVGLVTMINPPNSIEGRIGFALSVFWALLLTAGGLGGMFSVLPGWWWAERLSVWLAISGIGIYAGVVFSAQLVAPPGSSRWTQLGFIFLASAVFFLRLRLTREWDYEPRPKE